MSKTSSDLASQIGAYALLTREGEAVEITAPGRPAKTIDAVVSLRSEDLQGDGQSLDRRDVLRVTAIDHDTAGFSGAPPPQGGETVLLSAASDPSRRAFTFAGELLEQRPGSYWIAEFNRRAAIVGGAGASS